MRLGKLMAREPAQVDWERVCAESPSLYALAADIVRNGVREPIQLDADGKIVDGIHRAFACWLLSYGGDIPTLPGPGFERPVTRSNAYFEVAEQPTIGNALERAMLDSQPGDWREYWGWLALELDTRAVIAGDRFLEWLFARHPFRAGILSMEPESFYGWHTDGRRGVSVNMLTDFPHPSGTHFSMFALPRDKAHSTGRFIELRYKPSTYYLFNNQIEHAVFNFYRPRFVFTVEFEEDKEALSFERLKAEVEAGRGVLR